MHNRLKYAKEGEQQWQQFQAYVTAPPLTAAAVASTAAATEAAAFAQFAAAAGTRSPEGV